MTTAQIEQLREAISKREVPFDEMVASIGAALVDAMQAVDYRDWRFAYDRAQFAADVLKGMARR